MSSSLPKNTNEIIENILKIEDVKKLFKNKTAELTDYKIIQGYTTPTVLLVVIQKNKRGAQFANTYTFYEGSKGIRIKHNVLLGNSSGPNISKLMLKLCPWFRTFGLDLYHSRIW
jgi:hypothetical protein